MLDVRDNFGFEDLRLTFIDPFPERFISFYGLRNITALSFRKKFRTSTLLSSANSKLAIFYLSIPRMLQNFIAIYFTSFS